MHTVGITLMDMCQRVCMACAPRWLGVPRRFGGSPGECRIARRAAPRSEKASTGGSGSWTAPALKRATEGRAQSESLCPFWWAICPPSGLDRPGAASAFAGKTATPADIHSACKCVHNHSAQGGPFRTNTVFASLTGTLTRALTLELRGGRSGAQWQKAKVSAVGEVTGRRLCACPPE